MNLYTYIFTPHQKHLRSSPFQLRTSCSSVLGNIPTPLRHSRAFSWLPHCYLPIAVHQVKSSFLLLWGRGIGSTRTETKDNKQLEAKAAFLVLLATHSFCN